MNNKTIVFDLDDTLYNEVDFLLSAYREISQFLADSIGNVICSDHIYNMMVSYYQHKQNTFSEILIHLNLYNISVNDLLFMYRAHVPQIEVHTDVFLVLATLAECGFNLGIVTDGRSLQQRNKISSLGLDKYFENIIISEEFGFEKPNLTNFSFFENLFPNSSFFYIADNPKKDFIGPNRLGWQTICLLDNGKNIHKQNFDISSDYLPNFYVSEISKILPLIIT